MNVFKDPVLLVGFLPLFVAISYSTRDIRWLIGASSLLPIMVLCLRALDFVSTPKGGRDGLTGLPIRDALIEKVDQYFATPGASTRTAACLVVDLDEFHSFNERWGRDLADKVLRITADRLQSAVRDDDLVVRLDADAFALYLAPAEGMTLDAILSIADRLQRALSEPVPVGGTTTYTSACIGVALASKSPEANGASLLLAAERAMVTARAHGAGALRVYSKEMQTEVSSTHALAEDLAQALENGQIKAWFQPQISTDTGRVTGFEALARWQHPDRGTVSPAEFLPAIEATGRTERLSEVMLYQSLKALSAWERAGYHIPSVGVNFGGTELRNPHLVEKVKWELDRFGLSADRLSVEILENVVSETEDDIVLRNLAALNALGCKLDLDDFGTGNASISAIKRFNINRIKIDRSFVTKMDKDGDQQRMVSAILTMAHQLDVESLAEGVETLGEHSMLAQLGCQHVQGFGIARPMPLEDTFDWLPAYIGKLPATPMIPAKREA
ncbi:putative bifunctional diguanylate cyclase/phosphodiesterase [Tropicimonas sp. S265A]|uniref:putative bifunctional diguanylate cyclase/phosphodiesterase n=1 Tax=Tropicimonas sp. S265A TaxID=3415134 RepID=UPI003C7B4145